MQLKPPCDVDVLHEMLYNDNVLYYAAFCPRVSYTPNAMKTKAFSAKNRKLCRNPTFSAI